MHMNDRLNHQTAAEAIELRDYIRQLNAKGNGAFLLTLSLDHWAGYGVYTKAQLGDYLDGCIEHEDQYEDEYDRTMPECDDDPYYRECMAADTGDDMSKADYHDYYSRMGMEGDY